jgi:predicted nucleic acid-binding protein
MAGNFFDTSALGKHYHQELGTQKVDQILADRTTPHDISRLSTVELQSVFAKKVRTGLITQHDFELACRRFRGDIKQRKVRVIRLTNAHFEAAIQLLHRLALAMNLRTLDAIQLAVALALHSQGLVTQLICADKSLCTIAAGEGIAVVNPEIP